MQCGYMTLVTSTTTMHSFIVKSTNKRVCTITREQWKISIYTWITHAHTHTRIRTIKTPRLFCHSAWVFMVWCYGNILQLVLLIDFNPVIESAWRHFWLLQKLQCTVTAMLVQLGLPTSDTLLHNSHVRLAVYFLSLFCLLLFIFMFSASVHSGE